MYSELYTAWKAEIENPALQPLPADFYKGLSVYMQEIKTETQTPDKNNAKASLVGQERQNVIRMIKELLRTRYKKILKTVKGGQKLLPDILTNEETEFLAGLLPFAEAYSTFARGLLQGQTVIAKPKTETETPLHKRITLRFLKDIPGIIGGDMKTYGPFKTEDVASLPAENAKILVKQGLAQVVEVS